MIAVWSGSGMPPMLHAVAQTEGKLRGKRVVRVVAVDPGVITGIAVLWVDADTGKILHWAETMITFDELLQVFEIITLIRELSNHGVVHTVIEDFVVAEVNMSPDFLSPVRIGRQLEFAIFLMSRDSLGEPIFGKVEPAVFQSRSRKADYSNERLKKLGFYTPGKDHRRDATRHALVRWKQLKQKLPLLVASPDTPPGWDPMPSEPVETKRVGLINRTFNGKPAGTKFGQAPKRGVTREDLQRMKQQSQLSSRESDAQRSVSKRRKLL